MKVLVSGASGQIGSALAPLLTASGHEVVRLVRRQPEPDEGRGRLGPGARSPGGQPPRGSRRRGAPRRRGHRRRPLDCRAQVAYQAEPGSGHTVAGRDPGGPAAAPRVLVSASAIGVYGDRGDEELHETSPPGDGFLAEVGRDWEAATEPAAAAGIRVVLSRLRHRALPEGRRPGQDAAAVPARCRRTHRVGGSVDELGRLDDAIAAVLHALATASLAGPLNVVSPTRSLTPSSRGRWGGCWAGLRLRLCRRSP